jgi:hypothetical protein
MPDDEREQLHRDTIGKLVEATKFSTKHKKSLADDEPELADTPNRSLTDAEKARRLAELEAA